MNEETKQKIEQALRLAKEIQEDSNEILKSDYEKDKRIAALEAENEKLRNPWTTIVPGDAGTLPEVGEWRAIGGTMTYNSLQVGDKVRVMGAGPLGKIRVETVERLTKTQVITDRAKYSKSTGKEVGYADSWWPQRLMSKVE